jgi:hypothetical protein
MKAQSFQVRILKNQIAACLRLIALHVRSAILKLVDLENKLENAMSEQIQYSEAQIKEAFVKIRGCLKREWKPEMSSMINRLIGQKIKPNSPWNYRESFPIIQEMVNMGWRDWKIQQCLLTAEYLENN